MPGSRLLRNAWTLLIVPLAIGGAVLGRHAVADPKPTAVVAARADAPAELNLAGNMEVLEDPSGALTLDDVRGPAFAARFEPAHAVGDDLNFGYRRSAIWLRFSLTASQPSQRLLELAFPSLDDVRFFAPLNGGGYAQTETGDTRPFSSRPVEHRHFVFPISVEAGKSAPFYLRVASEGSLTVPLTLWPQAAFDAQDRRSYSGLSLYFGMLLALALYNLLLFFSLRDKSYLTYVAFTLSMAIGQASLAGLGNEFVWREHIAWGNAALPVGFALTGFFGALFTRQLLDTPHVSRLIDRMLIGHMAVFGLAIALVVVSYRYCALITTLSGASFTVTAVTAGVISLRRGYAGARFYLIAWTLLLIGTFVLALRNLGWLPTNTFTIYAMLVGSALEALLLSLALGYRIVVLKADRERLQSEALANARRAEQELETTVAWRTRELALTNEKLESAMATLERVAATDRLTGAWNRRWFEHAAEIEVDRAMRHETKLSLILIDIDRFKAINDRLGHAMGDRVLSTVSDLITENIRSSDSLTRWGGEEFLVLAPETDLAGAALLAEKLRALIERAAFPPQSPVTISAGVAQFRAGQRLEDFIADADTAMYRAKERGRNRVEAASNITLASSTRAA
jgi:diguanylate cyclase (GGDEF)-like protein